MRNTWLQGLIALLLFAAALWAKEVGIAAVAVLLAALTWGGFAAAALASGWLVGAYLLGATPASWIAGVFGLYLTALAGYVLKRRSDRLQLRQERVRHTLCSILHASRRVAEFEDPDELVSRAPRFFEGGFARDVALFQVRKGKVEVRSGGCDPADWHAQVLQVHEAGEPRYLDGVGRGAVRYLVPMCEGYVLCIEPSGTLNDDERALIGAYADLVCLVRRRLVENRRAEQLSQLMTVLASSRSLNEATEKVIQLLLPALDVSSGLVSIFRRGRFVPIAMAGRVPEVEREFLKDGLPAGQGGVWRAYMSRSPLFVEDYASFDLRVELVLEAGIRSLAFVPISGEGRARIVLVLQDEKPREWTGEERDFLALVARGLGLMAEQFLTRERLDALMQLEREVFDSPIGEAYDYLLDYAVQLVPGAEAGSLLTLAPQDEYRYTAAIGYDFERLRDIRYTVEDFRNGWYAQGPDAWSRGEPRILSARREAIAEASYRTAPSELIDQAGRVREIKANLCLPIVYQGEVLAVLNLDSFSDPDAFDADSIDAARAFAQQASLLLHEQHYRTLLERAASTDPLTGLPNRRAFDQDFAVFWRTAERYGHDLSVLIMDLTRFKQINDRFGHATGDRVLVEVGHTLAEITRNGDRVYRWGGDEFAVLLPHTNLMGAVRAAERYAQAIEGVCLEEVCIGANLGAATYPEDSEDPATLLRLADARMYQAKSEGIIVEPRP